MDTEIKYKEHKVNKCLVTGNECSSFSLPSPNSNWPFKTITRGYHYEIYINDKRVAHSFSHGAFKNIKNCETEAEKLAARLSDIKKGVNVYKIKKG